MSMMLRSLLRDPITRRPVPRALARRWNDDLFDDWPSRKVRLHPDYYSPVSVFEDMNRQIADTIERMNEIVEGLDDMDSYFGRHSRRSSRHHREDGETLVKRTESGGLQLELDVGHFKPEDLKIKLVGDNLVVEGTQELSDEDSHRRRQFKRWFKLPPDCKLDEIRSQLTEDNRLMIDLPSDKPMEQQKVRTVPIEVAKGKESEQPKLDSNQKHSAKDEI